MTILFCIATWIRIWCNFQEYFQCPACFLNNIYWVAPPSAYWHLLLSRLSLLPFILVYFTPEGWSVSVPGLGRRAWSFGWEFLSSLHCACALASRRFPLSPLRGRARGTWCEQPGLRDNFCLWLLLALGALPLLVFISTSILSPLRYYVASKKEKDRNRRWETREREKDSKWPEGEVGGREERPGWESEDERC